MKCFKHSCLWLLPTAFFVFGTGASGQTAALLSLDGDEIENAMDADMDSDVLENAIDEDFDNDGTIDMIDFAYNHDSPVDQELARPIADLVTEKLLEQLKPKPGSSLRVLVDSIEEPCGGWNCTTTDGISTNGFWRYPAGKPDQIDLFVGELPGESQIYAQYPQGPITHCTWQQGGPIYFCFTTLPMQAATITQLHQYILEHSNAYPETLPAKITQSTRITFYGDLSAFDGIDSIEQQQRALFDISRQ